MFTTESVRLTYAFDAYCPWCYGFGPTLRSFAQDNAHRIRLHIRSAGLYTDARARPVSAHPRTAEECERVTRLTGVGFGAGFARALTDGTTVADSTAAAAGLAVLYGQADKVGVEHLDAVEAVQQAWFVDGRSLADPEVYRDIADGLGLDASSVTAAYASPEPWQQARADFRALRRLHVTTYPTLLLHTTRGVGRLGGAVSTAAALTSALDQCLAGAFPRSSSTPPSVPQGELS
ncbi:DsbA family protein [Streptomyces griseorubiginosus]|uniref:DsbA family protein n=1 Tax=Streptomyces griseorubiginosus TaxID=67304 RepID=UPI0036E95919